MRKSSSRSKPRSIARWKKSKNSGIWKQQLNSGPASRQGRFPAWSIRFKVLQKRSSCCTQSSPASTMLTFRLGSNRSVLAAIMLFYRLADAMFCLPFRAEVIRSDRITVCARARARMGRSKYLNLVPTRIISKPPGCKKMRSKNAFDFKKHLHGWNSRFESNVSSASATKSGSIKNRPGYG